MSRRVLRVGFCFSAVLFLALATAASAAFRRRGQAAAAAIVSTPDEITVTPADHFGGTVLAAAAQGAYAFAGQGISPATLDPTEPAPSLCSGQALRLRAGS